MPNKVVCNKVGNISRRVGVQVDDLWELSDYIGRNHDVRRSEKYGVTICGELCVADVGVNFLEERKHDSEFGARRVEPLVLVPI